MLINVFQYIDKAIEVLDAERPNFIKAGDRLATALQKLLADLGQDILGVSFRVKESDSLKEKILRKDLCRECPDPGLLAYEVHDIIGVRVECRFLSDEKKIYEHLLSLFSKTDDGVYYYVPGKERVKLRLSTPQPEVQQNGFEIFRIDGIVQAKEFECNFELQIKSLVNSFWSEIEHKLIYKNKRVMMIDGFVMEQMSSLNKNLYLIDRQLNALYDRCTDQSTSFRQRQIENMLVVFINELFTRIVKENIGFEVGIKPLAESVMKYIFRASSFSAGCDEQTLYTKTLERTMEWIKKIDFSKIKVGEAIVFQNAPQFTDPLEQAIARAFAAGINDDFFCNLFFHILFSIETGTNSQDFASFVRYYRKRLVPDQTNETAANLEALLYGRPPAKLLTEETILELAAELKKDAANDAASPRNLSSV